VNVLLRYRIVGLGFKFLVSGSVVLVLRCRSWILGTSLHWRCKSCFRAA